MKLADETRHCSSNVPAAPSRAEDVSYSGNGIPSIDVREVTLSTDCHDALLSLGSAEFGSCSYSGALL